MDECITEMTDGWYRISIGKHSIYTRKGGVKMFEEALEEELRKEIEGVKGEGLMAKIERGRQIEYKIPSKEEFKKILEEYFYGHLKNKEDE